MSMKFAGQSREGVSVSSTAFTLTSWPFAAPQTPADDGRQRVVVGEPMYDRKTGVLAYGSNDPVPVDEWERLIGEHDFAPVLRGETEMPPARAYGESTSPQPRRQRTRGGHK